VFLTGISHKYTRWRALVKRSRARSHQNANLLLHRVTASVNFQHLEDIVERFCLVRVIMEGCLEIQKNVVRQTLDKHGTHILIPNRLSVEQRQLLASKGNVAVKPYRVTTPLVGEGSLPELQLQL
jgi:hypothetical protein